MGIEENKCEVTDFLQSLQVEVVDPRIFIPFPFVFLSRGVSRYVGSCWYWLELLPVFCLMMRIAMIFNLMVVWNTDY